MVSKKTIRILKLDEDEIKMVEEMGMSDRQLLGHYNSTKQEKWKMSTKDWIRKQYKSHR